jgi:hypothetical protein
MNAGPPKRSGVRNARGARVAAGATASGGGSGAASAIGTGVARRGAGDGVVVGAAVVAPTRHGVAVAVARAGDRVGPVADGTGVAGVAVCAPLAAAVATTIADSEMDASERTLMSRHL